MKEGDLIDRLEALSPQARRHLAQRIGLAPSSRRLVAYVSANADVPYDAELVRSHCHERLPEYMVPQNVVCLDELPRTPAGKIDRRALLALDVEHTIAAAEVIAPGDEVESILAEIWCAVLGLSEVGVTENFFELGGDSLLSIRVLSRAVKAGLTIDAEAFLTHPTIAEQARLAQQNTSALLTEEPVQAGPLPLTPIQSWLFEHVQTDPEHWNQSVWIDVAPTVSVATLTDALNQLVSRHDVLRMGFERHEGAWRQVLHDNPGRIDMQIIEEQAATAAERDQMLAQHLNGPFELHAPPLLRAAWHGSATGANRLLLVFHHLVVDALSIGTFIEDLHELCDAHIASRAPAKPGGGTPYGRWVRRMAADGVGALNPDETTYWLNAVDAVRVGSLPAHNHNPSSNLESTAQNIVSTLDVASTRTLLTELPNLHQSQMRDALLLALVEAVTQWAGHASVLVDVEGHGRERLLGDTDIGATAGWLTTVFPVQFSAATDLPLDQRLAQMRAQLRSIPNGGVGYGLLRTYGEPAVRSRLQQAPHPEICFNFLSRSNPPGSGHLTLANPPDSVAAHDRSARCERAYLLEVNTWVADEGELVSAWTFSSALFDSDTILDLTHKFVHCLQTLASSLSGETNMSAATTADFPLADLDSEEMGALAQQLERIDQKSRTSE